MSAVRSWVVETRRNGRRLLSQRLDTLFGFGNRGLSLGQRSFLFLAFCKVRSRSYCADTTPFWRVKSVRRPSGRLETTAELLCFLVKERELARGPVYLKMLLQVETAQRIQYPGG